MNGYDKNINTQVLIDKVLYDESDDYFRVTRVVPAGKFFVIYGTEVPELTTRLNNVDKPIWKIDSNQIEQLIKKKHCLARQYRVAISYTYLDDGAIVPTFGPFEPMTEKVKVYCVCSYEEYNYSKIEAENA